MRTQFNLLVDRFEDAERALHELEHNLITRLDAHRLGIMLFDSRGNLLTCNKQWERLYCLKYEAVKDYNMLEDTNLQKKSIWKPISGAFRGEDGIVEENYFSPEEWGKQGRPRWTEGYCLPLFDSLSSEDRIIGAALFLQDITARKTTMLEMDNLRKLLTNVQSEQEEICRRLSDFIGDANSSPPQLNATPRNQHLRDNAVSIPRREREVFKMLAAGYTVKEAAHQLGLGIKSVYTYRSRLLKRLSLSGDVELAIAWREIYQDQSLDLQSTTLINSDSSRS